MTSLTKQYIEQLITRNEFDVRHLDGLSMDERKYIKNLSGANLLHNNQFTQQRFRNWFSGTKIKN